MPKQEVPSILRAEKTDLKEILDLQYLAYQSEARLLGRDDIPPLRQNAADLAAEFASSVFLKAVTRNHRLVGSVRGKISGETLLIGKLMVHPSFQHQGIGTRLLESMETVSDCKRFELFTSAKSADNIRLYEKSGFSIFRQEEISPGLMLVYLQKVKKDSQKN